MKKLHMHSKESKYSYQKTKAWKMLKKNCFEKQPTFNQCPQM